MVEDIHIIQSHALQALIQAGHEILFAAPVAVRSGPHIITGFRGNHQFITIYTQILFQNTTEILFCRTVYRSVVVRQIEVCDTVIKSSVTHVQHVVKIPIGAKIVPQSQGDCRKLQSTCTTAVVFHFFISFFICLIHLNNLLLFFPSFLYYKFIFIPFLCELYRIKCNILRIISYFPQSSGG